jgi:hypothetical protein
VAYNYQILHATRGAHIEVVYHSAVLILQVRKLFELLLLLLLLLLSIFNCKCVFTRWQWYYNKTQYTNNTHHTK